MKNFEEQINKTGVEKEKSKETAKKIANATLVFLEEVCRVFPSPPGSASREFNKQVRENIVDKIKQDTEEQE